MTEAERCLTVSAACGELDEEARHRRLAARKAGKCKRFSDRMLGCQSPDALAVGLRRSAIPKSFLPVAFDDDRVGNALPI